MKGRFLIKSNKNPSEVNIYANKSALILYWLLKKGEARESFSLREVAKELGISNGLVQSVFGTLVFKGLLQTEGIRTSKKFFFKKSKELLEDWLQNYSITKKCKMRTYRSSFSGREELLEVLKKSKLTQKVALALHTAAEADGYKNTNLNTLELYLLDSNNIGKVENILELEPQERGYEVLLIEPYYESVLKHEMKFSKNIAIAPTLLTFFRSLSFSFTWPRASGIYCRTGSRDKKNL